MMRREWLILLAIVFLAAVLRFYQLGIVPPGPQFDEAFNAIDASQVLAGNRPLFLPANGGREVVYTYIQAAVGALFGVNLLTLRLVSAVAGTLTVVAIYLLVRRLFRRDSQRLAAFTALALAVSYWHIHFSHYGIRIILMPLLLCAVFGGFWLGMHSNTRRGRIPALLIGGALAGLGVWTNPTGRFVPFVVTPYALWLLWRYPSRRRMNGENPLAGLLLFGLAAFVVFLPLGLEFWRHPEFFTGHASEVSVFAERVRGEASPWSLLWNNIVRVLGMFSFDGDLEWAHGIPDRPVFDWFMAIAFYLGVVIWVLRLVGRAETPPEDRDALALFTLWAAVMLAPSVLSEAAPNYSRTLPAIPPIMLAAGLGLTWIATRLRAQLRLGVLLAGTLIAASLAVTFYDYFVRYPAMRQVYYVYDADKVDALNWMKAEADAGNTIYLSPLWSEHATVTFLRGSKIESLDATDALALPPPGKGAIYAFPSEQVDFAEQVAGIWAAEVEMIDDKYGRPLLAVVRVPADQAAGWPPAMAPTQLSLARFDDAPSVIGLRPDANGRDLLLYWQLEEPTIRDLTAFVHLIDGRNRRVGQADRAPGGGAFRTPQWSAGERVVQRFTPAIADPCAGSEEVRVITGWYEYAADGARRPRADAPGNTALAGSVTLPLRSVPAEQAQPPNLVDQPLAGTLRLAGYGIEGDLQPGAPLTFDLYFARGSELAELPLALALGRPGTPEAATATLWEGALAPGADWAEGELLCRRLHVQLPPATSLAPGDYTWLLTAGDQSVPFAPAALAASTRSFESPASAQATAVDATIGDAIRLAASEIAPVGDTLSVTLTWQALSTPAADAKVFVHLLAADGNLVAQSDATPAGDYSTNRWVAGEYVLDRHRFALPPALAAGTYALYAGMYDPITGQRLPAAGADGAPFVDAAVPLGNVSLP